MTTETKQIMDKLNLIQSELDYIKEHMVDIDTILTEEDKEALVEADEEFLSRKTVSHEKLKKELGL